MANIETKAIGLQVDVSKAADGVNAFGGALTGFQKQSNQLGMEITKSFELVANSIGDAATEISKVTEALIEATGSVSGLTESLPQNSEGMFDWVVSGFNGLVEAINSMARVDVSNGKILNLFEELATAPNISNFLKSMLPKSAELASTVTTWANSNLVPVFTNVFNNLGPVIGATAGSISAPFASVFQNIDQLVGGKISGIGDTIKTVFGGITTSMSSLSLGWGAIIAGVVMLVTAIVTNWDTIKAAIGTAAEWLNTNVIQPVVKFCTSLWNSITTIATNIWNGIVEVFSAVAQWFYDNVVSPLMEIFSPVVEWYSELFQSVWQTIFDVFHNIGVIITGCWDVITAVWGIAATWFNANVIQPVAQFFRSLWSGITGFAANAWGAIQNTFLVVGSWFNASVVQPVAGFFAGLWNGIQQAAVSAWEGVKRVFSTVATFFGDIFSKAWAGVVNVFSAAGNVFNNIKDGVLSVFKSVVNGLIDGINAVVAIPFRGINSALSFVRSVEIVGIKPFSGLRTLSIPQIPHLARGAVLPANKPFLAVVGDQRHGTNVEAPLTTIQEAVRVEVGEMMAVMATSLDALLRENRELRRTVERIRIGDEVIGQAARRYEHRMAIIGGSL